MTINLKESSEIDDDDELESMAEKSVKSQEEHKTKSSVQRRRSKKSKADKKFKCQYEGCLKVFTRKARLD